MESEVVTLKEDGVEVKKELGGSAKKVSSVIKHLENGQHKRERGVLIWNRLNGSIKRLIMKDGKIVLIEA